MLRGAWHATVHGVAEPDMTKQLNTHKLAPVATSDDNEDQQLSLNSCVHGER